MALFNNFSGLKNLRLMHVLTDNRLSLVWCKNEALKKIVLQKHHSVLQKSENRQVTSYHHGLIFPID